MMKNYFAVLLLVGGMAGCQTVTILPEPGPKLETEPSYQQTQTFYFWGLMGDRHIDVRSVCGDRKPVQMQSQLTFPNALLGVVTLGIYSPHTAKVWCQ